MTFTVFFTSLLYKRIWYKTNNQDVSVDTRPQQQFAISCRCTLLNYNVRHIIHISEIIEVANTVHWVSSEILLNCRLKWMIVCKGHVAGDLLSIINILFKLTTLERSGILLHFCINWLINCGWNLKCSIS